MMAAVKGTRHEDSFNARYAWDRLWMEFADELEPTGFKEVDDIKGGLDDVSQTKSMAR